MADYIIKIKIPGEIAEEYFTTVAKGLRYQDEIPNPDAGKVLVEGDEEKEPELAPARIPNDETREQFFEKEIIKWMNGVYQTEKSNEQLSVLDGIVGIV